MDKRERMAREKRAKAKAGRVERVRKRRQELDRARALDASSRELRKTLLSGRLPDELAADLDTAVTAVDAPAAPPADDSSTNAQGEAVA